MNDTGGSPLCMALKLVLVWSKGDTFDLHVQCTESKVSYLFLKFSVTVSFLLIIPILVYRGQDKRGTKDNSLLFWDLNKKVFSMQVVSVFFSGNE